MHGCIRMYACMHTDSNTCTSIDPSTHIYLSIHPSIPSSPGICYAGRNPTQAHLTDNQGKHTHTIIGKKHPIKRERLLFREGITIMPMTMALHYYYNYNRDYYSLLVILALSLLSSQVLRIILVVSNYNHHHTRQYGSDDHGSP